VSGKRPLQRRAIETRRRLYEAALDQFEQVGVAAARVEDIVVAAGVSWGTFFRYFPRKEDVLVEFAGQMGRAFASAARSGLERGDPTVRVAASALTEAGMTTAGERPALRQAMLRESAAHPEMLAAYLAEQGVPSMVDTMTDILEAGQRGGEVRDDFPARVMAQIAIAAVFGAYSRELNAGTRRGAESYVIVALGLMADGFVPRPERPSAR
jgi:AcrR family transcriptional regulator